MANALTISSNGIVNVIKSSVEVSNPFTKAVVDTQGIWDTGATQSVITKSTAQKLGLPVISKAIVNGVHGAKEVNVYYVGITLNNREISIQAEVTECEELSADHTAGMLIGMNIITMGDFCFTNADGHSVMSFVVPSQKRIDFVEEIGKYNKYVKIHQSWLKVGNHKCPCGSGKKWENCHGKIHFKS